MRKIKNQNGAISLFVLLSMLFFLVFMIGAFSLVSKRSTSQIQALKETQELYKSGLTGKEIYDSMFETTDIVIPISNKEQLAKVIEIMNFPNSNANASYMIDGKMYTYTKDANYILKNDIILDLKDEIDAKNNITIYDYALYADKYRIDANGYDIYYAQKDGSLWKCVCYQNMGLIDKQNLFSNVDGNEFFYGKSYYPDRYSILKNGLEKYEQIWDNEKCFELMLMYNSDNKVFDTDNKYNRWRQTNNPALETKKSGESKATGYNINYSTNSNEYGARNGINPSDYNWGGLMQGGIYYYLAGGIESETVYYYSNNTNDSYYYNNDNYYYYNSDNYYYNNGYYTDSTVYYYEQNKKYHYPVGKTNYEGANGINVTDNINASECLLFVRVK